MNFVRLTAIAAFVITLSAQASIKYDPSSKRCPLTDGTNHYISVPILHDLSKIAKTSNIPNLQTHDDLQESFKGMDLSLYFESVNEIDENKELVIIIPGGPGESHFILHELTKSFSGKSDFFEKYNVIAMDHRGLGCSRPIFPGNEPEKFLTMKYAAADIEMIKQQISPNKKIHVWGHSYGSMLAQTYGLLFPESINKLFLVGAFSSYKDFNQAKRDYEGLVSKSSVGSEKYNSLIKKFPQYKNKFLNFTIGPMYSYEGRIKSIPNTFDQLSILLETGQFKEADKLLSTGPGAIMPWMMRSIMCLEIMDTTVQPGVFPMFETMINSCNEFVGQTDYFDYTKSLKNLKMDTFIWGGKFDHVTPAKAMKKMSRLIPNNFLYIDQHMGHGFNLKIDCLIQFMDNFFDGSSMEVIESLSTTSQCIDKPVI
jgi:pimeloyl-ACP methyl ester carboxylesterase